MNRKILVFTLTLAAVSLWASIIIDNRDRATPAIETTKRRLLPRTPPAEAIEIDSLTTDRGACSNLILLSIGTIDSEFKISRGELRRELERAADEWRDATGRQWFTIQEKGGVVVNFLYDDRQRQLTKDIEDEQRLANLLKLHAAQLQETKSQSETVAAEVATFQQSLDNLQKRITNHQRHQAAISDEASSIQAFNQEAVSLNEDLKTHERQRQQLFDKRKRLIEVADALHVQAVELNNRTAALRSQNSRAPYPSGHYRRAIEGKSIDIFAFADLEDLHATLLHELGHAMGLDHLTEPASIMFALHTRGAQDTHLNKNDVAAALSLCPYQKLLDLKQAGGSGHI